ncbi:hypothetical protein HELRODRAFT_78885 [Helobdella robusta]|uniref:VWF/SSPO/Zonadhesin-like cysteine-rich domain-containing protein n=1 Tax=Helobdella robusta TaxID=6412 RepID=T1G3G9_HELRO|nr:hypothetical protein HELRODRAFT_78885 [Helobdella robusta]ESO04763.1 hypothetical protein HELRODRAFT_78885 [Helobdella robusta]
MILFIKNTSWYAFSQAHPERVAWATSSCSIITKGAVFADCRKVVNYETFFQECMAASCDCDTGGDCQCMCTAIESFVSACVEQGVCVSWRSNHFCR